MTNTNYFTKKECLLDIKETLSYYDSYICDLHSQVFNSDYYIIGVNEAKKVLNEYGVFDAIEKIKEYETFNFGEIYTDFSNPEKIVNMLYYIIGEETINEIMNEIDEDIWNEEVNEYNKKLLLNSIEKLLD